jgi:aspartate dehydrogenase
VPETLRVSLIGYGAVGQEVTRLLTEQMIKDITIVGALVRHHTQQRPPGPPIVATRSALLAERPHIIVEAAGHEGLREHGAALLREGIDLLLISVGALADNTFMEELLAAAQVGNAHIRVVSGAIGALDALAAASLGGLTSVLHTMRKPPQELLPPKEAAQITTIQEVFRGSARQAAIRFPTFLNVAAAVALAGKGFDQTEVLVLADPTIERSRHEIVAEGAFGRLQFEIKNTPIQSHARGHAWLL